MSYIVIISLHMNKVKFFLITLILFVPTTLAIVAVLSVPFRQKESLANAVFTLF